MSKEPTTLWSVRLTAEDQRKLECVKKYKSTTKAGVFRVMVKTAYDRLPPEAK